MKREKNEKNEIIMCKRCVMDNDNTNISFDEEGICNFCTNAIKRMSNEWNPNGKKELDLIIKNIKEKNKQKKYDCIIGISGGIDSCYCAYFLKKEYNLRMLGVHIDGGWNTSVSERNIKKLCETLNIDIEIVKIDKKEIFELQRSYFLSEVKNLDVPQDHIFFSVLYRYAIKNKIKDFISGGNFSSESILPSDWIFNAMDGYNLKDIHKKFGRIPLKKIKPLGFWEIYLVQPYIHKLKKIRPLNYINYDKSKAIEELHKKIGFEYYGGKHCESSFTRLYQGYILPVKYGINKSKAHLSSLIVSNQITKEEALKELESNDYINSVQLELDINDFITKIDISREEFDKIISSDNIRDHREFKNFEKLYTLFKEIIHIVKR